MAARKGKYAHIVDKLPRMPLVEPERRDAVQQLRAEILAPAAPDDNLGGDSRGLADAAGKEFYYALKVVKRSTAGRPWAAEYARAYAECRALADRVKQWESDLNLLTEAFLWMMVDQMEVEGVSSMKLANGQPVSTYLEPYAQVADKEKFRLWCIANGLETKLSLPWQTTNSLTKERLLAGEPEPDGVTSWSKTRVRLGAE